MKQKPHDKSTNEDSAVTVLHVKFTRAILRASLIYQHDTHY